MAQLTPCFISTLFILPEHFHYFNRAAAPGAQNAPLTNFVDLLIVDEAGQVPPEVGAPALALAEKALIIGDIHQQRGVDLGSARGDAEHFLEAIRRKSKGTMPKRECEFEFASLDRVRAAETLNEVPGSITLGGYITRLNRQVTSTGFSTSDLASSLVDMLEVWRASGATLNIFSPSKRFYVISIDGDGQGITDCKIFVKPGKHNLSATLDGKPVFNKDVDLQKNEERKIEITSP